MPKASEEERVEALGGVPSDEVANTPTADRSEGEEGRRELGGRRHGRHWRVEEKPHFSQRTREMGRPATPLCTHHGYGSSGSQTLDNRVRPTQSSPAQRRVRI